MKRIGAILLCAALLFCPVHAVEADIKDDKEPAQTEQTVDNMPEISAPCGVLADMDGNILCGKNAHEKRAPASVTKVMTMLLIMEAMENGEFTMDDVVSVSEYAASMGGTQVYLAPNEQMSVRDLLKSIAVASANDACVAMAEKVAGSETLFVQKMNERAQELGMMDTHFVNCNGLTAKGHVTSAHDIAKMSAELMKHDMIREFTTIWMDTIRDGKFTLANTNKMIKYYQGATGLKTGFTTEAMYCISATAQRSGVELIAVVMGAQTIPDRTRDVSKLLDYGFACFENLDVGADICLPEIPVSLGEQKTVLPVLFEKNSMIIEKNRLTGIEKRVSVSETLKAPVEKGQVIGKVEIWSDGQLLRELELVADRDVERKNYLSIFKTCCYALIMHPEK